MTVLFFYRLFLFLLSPLILVWLFIRMIQGKEDRRRFKERLGFAGHKRPAGPLIWMHGASVGECLSMLPLVDKLLKEDPKRHIMITSGTRTSAELMKKRLPARAFHHYIPVDFKSAGRRFLRHFKPDAVLWFESEFWPNILTSVHEADIPLILLNGRISDRSFCRWQHFPYIIRSLLQLFTTTFGQSAEDAHRLEVLGAREVLSVGNLKCAAACAPYQPSVLKEMQQQIGHRPCWCAASTHEGEEILVADIHTALKNIYPKLLTIVVPRHPQRGNEVEEIFQGKDLIISRRSRGEKIKATTDIYLADTIGEMGLLYRLAPIVFVGGSLIPFGGQNMLEPMRLARTVLVGPHTFNFREIMRHAKKKGAIIEVKDKMDLCGNLVYLLKHPETRQEMGHLAEQMAVSEMGVLNRVYRALEERIKNART